MPWKDLCTMQVREAFVLEAQERDANFTALCREYGITRKTGYKWVARYKEHGLAGLVDQSRRPHSSPCALDGDTVAELVRLRTQHPSWGPKKLSSLLQRYTGKAVSKRTVARTLERAGLTQAKKQRRRRRVEGVRPTVEAHGANELWTVDFKGWWLMRNGKRCEPLTVRDAFSRFVLDVHVLPSTHLDHVIPAFETIFGKYGIPEAILTDNGTPFRSPQSEHGLTRLVVWWLSLGIDNHYTRPATPSDNGGHERMHRDIAEEVERYAALDTKAQQDACDRWRHNFNHHRPHEALQMKTPAEVYTRSVVDYAAVPTQVVYPDGFMERIVSANNLFKFNGRTRFASRALVGRTIGIEPLGKKRYRLWFASRALGEFHESDEKVTWSISNNNEEQTLE